MEGDLPGAERRVAGRAAGRIADLARNLRAVDECSALGAEPFAEERLAGAAAIGVRGVEAAQPDVAGMVEELERGLFAVAGVAQVGRGAEAAEIAAAEPDPADVALTQHCLRLALRQAPSELELCKEVLHHVFHLFVRTQAHRSARPLPACPSVPLLEAEDDPAWRGRRVRPPGKSPSKQADEQDNQGR